MLDVRCRGTIRYWDPAKGSGLAVVDLPAEAVSELGGLKQQRVRGRLGGAPFASNVMPAGGGRLVLSVSKAMQAAAGAGIGSEVDIEISGIGRDEP